MINNSARNIVQKHFLWISDLGMGDQHRRQGMRAATAAMANTLGAAAQAQPKKRNKSSRREFVFLREEEKAVATNRYFLYCRMVNMHLQITCALYIAKTVSSKCGVWNTSPIVAH